ALYVIGGLKTEQVLTNETPAYFGTEAEKENVALAAFSLVVALIFARVLLQTKSTKQPALPHTPSAVVYDSGLSDCSG
ncbi:MAG: hypothetical protein WBQ91_01510, partial [Candidatus Acidiferrum sp.]